MGLFDFLKGSSKVKTGKGISFEEAKKIVVSELERERSALLAEAPNRFAEIKHLLMELERNASSLDAQDVSEGENKRLRQIVSTAKTNLARKLKGLSQKLMPPASFDEKTLREYCVRSLNVLRADLLPYWKSILISKALLSDDVKAVGESIMALDSVINEVYSAAFSEKLVALEKMHDRLISVDAKDSAALDLEGRTSELKREVDSVSKKIGAMRQRLLAESNSKVHLESVSLKAQEEALEKQKEAVVDSFVSSLGSLERPLKKFSSVAEKSGVLDSKEKEILSMVLASPRNVFIADPNGLTLKSVLLKTGKAIEKHEIDVKNPEKLLKVISGFSEKDFFSDFFWRMNKVQAEIINVRKKLVSNPVAATERDIEADLESANNNLIGYKKEVLAVLSRKKAVELESGARKKDFLIAFNSFFAEKYFVKQ